MQRGRKQTGGGTRPTGLGKRNVGGVPSPRFIYAMRLPHVIPFARTPIYFFTACTAARRSLLANATAFACLSDVWGKSAELDGWFVGRFVLMPDHAHFFAAPSSEAKGRGEWIKLWKSVSARRLAKEFNVSTPFWQEDTFDHLLRSTE